MPVSEGTMYKAFVEKIISIEVKTNIPLRILDRQLLMMSVCYCYHICHFLRNRSCGGILKDHFPGAGRQECVCGLWRCQQGRRRLTRKTLTSGMPHSKGLTLGSRMRLPQSKLVKLWKNHFYMSYLPFAEAQSKMPSDVPMARGLSAGSVAAAPARDGPPPSTRPVAAPSFLPLGDFSCA